MKYCLFILLHLTLWLQAFGVSGEFREEVISFLANGSDEGFFDPTFNRERAENEKKKFIEDKRDWEGVFVELMESRSPLGKHVISLVNVRGTAADPRVIKAICGELQRRADEIEGTAKGGEKYQSKVDSFRIVANPALGLKQPQILKFFLEKLNRDQEMFLEASDDFIYKKLFDSLAISGNQSHLEDLGKLLELLKLQGKNELFLRGSDVLYAMERKFDSNFGGELDGRNSEDVRREKKESSQLLSARSEGSFRFFRSPRIWLAAFSAIFLSLAGWFLWKRLSDR